MKEWKVEKNLRQRRHHLGSEFRGTGLKMRYIELLCIAGESRKKQNGMYTKAEIEKEKLEVELSLIHIA